MWIDARDLTSLRYLRCSECHRRPGGDSYWGEWAMSYENGSCCPHIPVVGGYDRRDNTHTLVYATGTQDCPCGCGLTSLVAATDGEHCWDVAYSTAAQSLRDRRAAEGVVACEFCLTVYPAIQIVSVASGNSIDQRVNISACGSCVRRSTHLCARCNLVVDASYSRRYTMRNASTGLDEVSAFCNPCGEGMNLTQCSHCSTFRDAVQVPECGSCQFDEDGEVPNCGCYQCNSGGRWIHNYSYRPIPDFGSVGEDRRIIGGIDRSLYLGIELEVEVPGHLNLGQLARKVTRSLADRCYLKSDGSINNGFEIVSHPATLDHWMSKFAWDAIRRRRLSGELKAESNCGLHIHASRAALDGKTHQLRLMQFWWRNQYVMKLLAGRTSSYAEYSDGQRAAMTRLVKLPAGQQYGQRYSAINTNNEHTLEFRVFESTLFVNRIKSALQLVESTIEYTRQLAVSKILADGGYTWSEYVAWLEARKGRYSDLLTSIHRVTKGNDPRYRADERRVHKLDRHGSYEFDQYGSYLYEYRKSVTMEGVK